jgi:hypothetical protein
VSRGLFNGIFFWQEVIERQLLGPKFFSCLEIGLYSSGVELDVCVVGGGGELLVIGLVVCFYFLYVGGPLTGLCVDSSGGECDFDEQNSGFLIICF